MPTRLARSAVAGLLAGFMLFFVSYWWLGSITGSAIVGAVIASLVARFMIS